MMGGDESGDTEDVEESTVVEEEAVGLGGGVGERKGGLVGDGGAVESGEPICMAGDEAACGVGGEEVARADAGESGVPPCMAGDGYACITGWVWAAACCVAARCSRKSRSIILL